MSTIKVVNIQHPDGASPAISLNSDGTIASSSLTTSDVSEGSNLYYTDARVDARIASESPKILRGSVLWNASGSAQSVTFSEAFSTAPIVVGSPALSGGPGGDLGQSVSYASFVAEITTTGFKFVMFSGGWSSNNWYTGQGVPFNWIAIEQ